jgi:ParB family chromosome partitioning protein
VLIADKQKRALGRGLSALIPQAQTLSGGDGSRGVQLVALDRITRDGRQPRKYFDEAKLKELAASLKSQGVLQPLLLRRDGERYRLIAGERRWRAAQLAGLKEVPCLVREATDAEAFQMALVENLQRADLNPLEEADGYKRLIDEFSLTQEQVSQRVGKDRSSVANALRLLGLPEELKTLLRSGGLNMGQARALLGAPNETAMLVLARQVADSRLSVRATEKLVKARKPVRRKVDGKAGAQARHIIEELQRVLGTKVRLTDRGGKGTLEIDFFSYEDLERILHHLRS